MRNPTPSADRSSMNDELERGYDRSPSWQDMFNCEREACDRLIAENQRLLDANQKLEAALRLANNPSSFPIPCR